MRPPLLAALVLVALAPSACTRVDTAGRSGDTPAPPTFDVPAEQTFGGRVWLGGQDFAVVLELRRLDSRELSAHLTVPELTLDARGDGTVTTNLLLLDLEYGDSCRGRLRLDARLEEGGTRAEGTLEASDCTGEESGPVALTRRPVADGEPDDPRR